MGIFIQNCIFYIVRLYDFISSCLHGYDLVSALSYYDLSEFQHYSRLL